jgi:hypothetical protein
MSWWTPECLPDGRRQAGDRHLNFHKDWDNLIEGQIESQLRRKYKAVQLRTA